MSTVSRTATAMLMYRTVREIGRASSTSRVPRARSPAIEVEDAPTAKMPIIAMASGCWRPSVIVPGRSNSEPEPKFSSSSGMMPEVAMSRKTSLNAS